MKDPNNHGIVVYSKTDNPGELKARYFHNQDGCGAGFATNGPSAGYAGNYQVCYYDIDGNLAAKRDLLIKKMETHFELLWYDGSQITCKGVGMEVNEGLAVSYQNCR